MGIAQRTADAVLGALAGTFGLEVDGIRVLETRGRSSGNPHRTPVKPVSVDGVLHLVALYGEVDWVRNLRQEPRATLRLGRRVDELELLELPVAQRVPALSMYLARASRQATRDLLGAGEATASEAHLRTIAAEHPVFRATARR